MFQKFFRSMSNDIQCKDDSTYKKESYELHAATDTILSPVATQSLFAKSQSEELLDKVVDRVDEKNTF